MNFIYKGKKLIGAYDETYSKKGSTYNANIIVNDYPKKTKTFKTEKEAKSYINNYNSKTMATKKKPSPAQLKARANFAKMAKDGTLAKKRALNAPAKRKATVSAKKMCRKVIKQAGINKVTGRLLKGWKYEKGIPVKVVAKKKPVAKKTATKKK